MKEIGRYVYLLTNKWNTVLYIGITENLVKRVYKHREKMVDGFSKRYNLTKIVYYERFETIIEAIAREKQLKNWKHEWKVELIKKMNPTFTDLYENLL